MHTWGRMNRYIYVYVLCCTCVCMCVKIYKIQYSILYTVYYARTRYYCTWGGGGGLSYCHTFLQIARHPRKFYLLHNLTPTGSIPYLRALFLSCIPFFFKNKVIDTLPPLLQLCFLSFNFSNFTVLSSRCIRARFAFRRPRSVLVESDQTVVAFRPSNNATVGTWGWG